MVKSITSRTNSKIISTSSLQKKKYRDEYGEFLMEGKKLLAEAVSAGVELTDIFCLEDNLEFCTSLSPSCDITVVPENVFEKLSTEKSPEGVISVAKIPSIHRFDLSSDDLSFENGRSVLLLSEVRDPGNVGTIIRTAAAMGIDELIMSSDCADPYSSRAVRASMGNLFRQKITYTSDFCRVIGKMRSSGYKVYAAMLDKNAVRADEIQLGEKVSFILGNEGHGIGSEVLEASGNTVYIPMAEGVESLNVSAAATIFMWLIKRV